MRLLQRDIPNESCTYLTFSLYQMIEVELASAYRRKVKYIHLPIRLGWHLYKLIFTK